MGMPQNASEHGYLVDHMLEVCHWFMLVLFIGWSAYLMYALVRFHRTRNPRANYHGIKSKVSSHLEFMVVLFEAVLFLGFAVPLWATRVSDFPVDGNALRLRAIGEQFHWNYHYPGPDGVFGRSDTDLVTGTNPLGLDSTDPSAKDDVVSRNDMHLVNHRPVIIEIGSKDVIHSLSIHHMRTDQDAIPGLRIPMWFRPIRIGEFEIVCAQLCGAGHAAMKSICKVETQVEFDAWIKEKLELSNPEATTPPASPLAMVPSP